MSGRYLSFFLLYVAVASASPAVHYRIQARLDSHRLTGTATITIRNPLPETLRDATILLWPNAVKQKNSAYAIERANSGKFDLALAPACAHGGYQAIWNPANSSQYPADSTTIRVRLSLAPGDSVALQFAYSLTLGEPFAEWGQKGQKTLLVHWYPQVALLADTSAPNYHLFGHAPAELADFEVELTLPDSLTIASNATATTLAGPGRTWHLTAQAISDLVVVASPDLRISSDSTSIRLVTVASRRRAPAEWKDLGPRIAAMIRLFTHWYGPPPFSRLTIVQADGLVPNDASYPGLILVTTRPIPGTRYFESTVARLVAAQWFSYPRSVDELAQPATALGPATYAEIRYMQLHYGNTNLITQPFFKWLLRGLSAEYYHRFYRHVAASNRLLRPADTPVTAFRDRFEFDAANVSAAGLRVLDSARAASCSLVTTPRRRPPWIVPLFALPEFDHYQFFFGPYFWYDSYHGFQLTGWVQGRRFIDAGPLRGSHNWTLTEAYFTELDDWHSSFWYQTPLSFLNPRLRVIVRADYSEITAEARAGLQQELGRVFGKPNSLAEIHYRLSAIRDVRLRDSRAWESARTADIRAQFTHNHESAHWLGRERLFVAWGSTRLGGQFDYLKVWFEQGHTFRMTRTSAIRLHVFAGTILGSVPRHDRYYLSGGLGSNPDEPISWGYQGWTSGQENWHYEADCNVRGYAGQYRHANHGWGINLYLQPIKQFQPFFDIGAVADSFSGLASPRMDAGVRLRLGPLYADFPFWISHPEPNRQAFAFRWMLGLRLTD